MSTSSIQSATVNLVKVFQALAANYTNDLELIDRLWQEIQKRYSEKKRYYHTLIHLENLILELTSCKMLLQDWDVILFAVFYHDIVYKATKKDNEEKSASIAQDRMKIIGVSIDRVQRCSDQIKATKNHSSSNDPDTNFFTDADLSILGQGRSVYDIYTQQVRKEYSIYPDILYKPGRRKVLQYFLGMDRIFKTDFFSNKYENQARQNIQAELDKLSQ